MAIVALSANGAVKANIASGLQNLRLEVHQEKNVSKPLMRQGKTECSTTDVLVIFIEEDKETGLLYAKARFYDPDTGKFLSEDAWEGDHLIAPSLHRYLYAYQNPTVYVDRDGNQAFPTEVFNNAMILGRAENTNEAVEQVMHLNRLNRGVAIGVAVDTPVQVAQGIGQMIAHPIDTTGAIVSGTIEGVVNTYNTGGQNIVDSTSQFWDEVEQQAQTDPVGAGRRAGPIAVAMGTAVGSVPGLIKGGISLAGKAGRKGGGDVDLVGESSNKVAPESDNTEKFYRAMCREELCGLDNPLGIKPNSGAGNYVTQDKSYVDHLVSDTKIANEFDVVVELSMPPGTKKQLQDKGVLENSGPAISREGLSDKPTFRGMTKEERRAAVALKSEGPNDSLTYGLRPGESVDTFNENIVDYKIVEEIDK